jgi:hypothetical protein
MNEAIGLARDIFGGLPAIASCVVSFAAVWLLRVALPAAAFDLVGLAAGTSLGFFAGYAAVREEWAALVPKQSWQWLPYLGIATAGLAAVPAGRGRLDWLRGSRMAIAAIASGCFLTPSWPIFGIAWPLTIGLASAYLLLLAGMIDVLSIRQFERAMLVALPLSAAAAAVAIGAEVSVRYGQLAGLATASLAGASLARLYCGSLTESSNRGSVPVFAVLIGGISLIATAEPERPAIGLLLPPLIPALIWLAVAAFRRRGRLPPH